MIFKKEHNKSLTKRDYSSIVLQKINLINLKSIKKALIIHTPIKNYRVQSRCSSRIDCETIVGRRFSSSVDSKPPHGLAFGWFGIIVKYHWEWLIYSERGFVGLAQNSITRNDFFGVWRAKDDKRSLRNDCGRFGCWKSEKPANCDAVLHLCDSHANWKRWMWIVSYNVHSCQIELRA